LTPANFRAAIDLVNGFCASRGDVPDCSVLPAGATPLSIDPMHYVVSEFSVITEIFNADTDTNGLSIGLHLRGLGLYNFR
jgi:hypothetical protein